MKKSIWLVLTALAAASAQAEVRIAESIPYQDESMIDHRITSECTAIGSIMSESLAGTAQEKGIEVVRTADDLAAGGDYAKIEIVNAVSYGNAFIGHAKGITVSAELFRNGKSVHKTSFNRNSGGGFFGGFKGSCAVLNRTAKVLGKDMAVWLKQKSK